MLAVWQDLTVTIAILWQLLIYYLFPKTGMALRLYLQQQFQIWELHYDKCPLSEIYTQQNVTLESSALNANGQLCLPLRIWKSDSKAMKKTDLCPLTHWFWSVGNVVFRDTTQWMVKQSEIENEAINPAEPSPRSTQITKAGMRLSN